jgi:rubrerythrin
MSDEEGEKLDFSKIRKNSRNYQDMTDEQRTQWNEYQKLKQREYRAKRKAERNALEDNAAGNMQASKLGVIAEEGKGTEKIVTGTALYLCSDCGEPLKGGEDECPKCSVLCDWRGTEIESGPLFVVCGLCGFAEPVTEFTGICKRCGWDGK